jgi:hypothetical protein
VIRRIGTLLDMQLLAVEATGREVGPLSVQAVVRTSDARSNWQLDALIAQYKVKVQQQTAGLRFLSIAGPDASRVGTKKYHLSIGYVPGGLAWHSPPQVVPSLYVVAKPDRAQALFGFKTKPTPPDDATLPCAHFIECIFFGQPQQMTQPVSGVGSV